MTEAALLGPAEVRELAARLGIRPTKSLGQNFVHDPNTIRRIVKAAELSAHEPVLEVGPGLGSLSLGILAVSGHLTAVEIDPVLAAELPVTVAAQAPDLVGSLTVVVADALNMGPLPEPAPTALVANLPYNVSVPVLLHLLNTMPSLDHGLVMVQLEVADRLVAPPGSKVYGVPSAKLAWYGAARRVGTVPRTVFWPVPNVESGLVRFRRQAFPDRPDVPREAVFAVIDAAFSQRRKMLRSALASWAGSPARAEAILDRAGVDPTARGETIDIEGFVRVAAARD
ncbi:16S rRNA (adenine(1518)-N(6)/adenine(1519)-N(6))-dimethyltransferase RsmA [Jatrophihabitans telluris]|uniref:Ribosomal RNA small subunit methyltransferase A n=1 Tax=Jatrophihabitans telluris TaxID=2038343 RepID=A0ABY4R0X4_9ACTN|nr:16S rRNA (adenine(1518)-N(6)/adenine(1519)-N(6))-dimethyltransferase RsmA [Jatrophihabitans telluris]UQX89335.1 16S rRNA (adenine(1518)-N(6)/adenine(1519)-N(6))-dimethyltransferase RsmA [Jatrophihabitans telluris]